MHEIEPFYNWKKYYNAHQDQLSPFFGLTDSYTAYTNTIYNYYIHPDWDYIGSETLYIKILYTNYEAGFTIIELMGEWNDLLHNDIMHLKRNVLDHLLLQGIQKYILLGENILNFHGEEDYYYEEWFDELETGWIATCNFRAHVLNEFKKIGIDCYLNFGGQLDEIEHWRTQNPVKPKNLNRNIEKSIKY